MRRTMIVAVISAVVGALVAMPLVVRATHNFNDVPDSNTFHSDIEWLAQSGVTKGCNPPDNTLFCPDDVVTRQTMAAFLHRLAVNRVVEAAYAVESESSQYAQNATIAGHAETADQANSAMSATSADTAVTATSAEFADDADTVDGLHASDLTAPGAAVGHESLVGTIDLQTAATTIFDQTYVPPAGGGVLLCQASTTILINHTTGTQSYVLLRINDPIGSGPNPGGSLAVPDTAPSGTYRFPVSVQDSIHRSGGANRCILETETTSGTNAQAVGGSMVAIYAGDNLAIPNP